MTSDTSALTDVGLLQNAERCTWSTDAAQAEGEQQLVTRLLDGDEQAYAAFVRNHAGRMLIVARRLLRHEPDAQQAVRAAFDLACRELPSAPHVFPLAAWLQRLVVRAAAPSLRSSSAPELPSATLLPSFRDDGHHAETYGPWPISADALQSCPALRARVRAAIDRLPATYRTVLLLRDVERLDDGRIAILLGLTPMVVRQQVHRARQSLRALLDPIMREGTPTHDATSM